MLLSCDMLESDKVEIPFASTSIHGPPLTSVGLGHTQWISAALNIYVETCYIASVSVNRPVKSYVGIYGPPGHAWVYLFDIYGFSLIAVGLPSI